MGMISENPFVFGGIKCLLESSTEDRVELHTQRQPGVPVL